MRHIDPVDEIDMELRHSTVNDRYPRSGPDLSRGPGVRCVERENVPLKIPEALVLTIDVSYAGCRLLLDGRDVNIFAHSLWLHPLDNHVRIDAPDPRDFAGADSEIRVIGDRCGNSDFRQVALQLATSCRDLRSDVVSKGAA
jgi:hypothetical protein